MVVANHDPALQPAVAVRGVLGRENADSKKKKKKEEKTSAMFLFTLVGEGCYRVKNTCQKVLLCLSRATKGKAHVYGAQ